MNTEHEGLIIAGISALTALLAGAIKGLRALFKMQSTIQEHDDKLVKLDEEITNRFDKQDVALMHMDAKFSEGLDTIYSHLLNNK